jgi:hypothetical protein
MPAWFEQSSRMPFTLVCAAVSACPAQAATRSFPPPVKACGSITNGTSRIAVDIDEADGGAMVSCAVARPAMATYLRKAGARRWPRADTGRSLDFVYARKHFACYTSRPDRIGWDFHCSFGRSSNAVFRFVDIGAGRRGRVCRLQPFERRCPPG